MKQTILSIFLVLFGLTNLSAQNIVSGIVKNGNSSQPIQGAIVRVQNTEISQVTNADGSFSLKNVPNGKQMVVFTSKGFETQNFPITLKGNPIDLGEINLYEGEFSDDNDLSTIVISDDELNDDISGADNISGLLQSSRDVFLRSAAFEWSPSFFRIRGLDSENAKLLINGVEMNKLYNGRPQWGNWGGLNDVMRNQEFSNGFGASNYTFGGALGSTHISTRASEYRSGTRISYASSNRSYVHRAMATHSSGMLKNGWAYSVSASRRAANEGYQDGTSYNTYSFFASIEKKLTENQSLNFTGIYAFNKKGKSAPHSQEVYDLKGTKYNEYWGYQNGKMRNSRLKRIEEPILMLSHYWDISNNTSLNTNVAYQFGQLGNSRIDNNGSQLVNGQYFAGGSNPSPVYYRKLPSFYLSNPNGSPDYAAAYLAEQELLNNGQVNWDALYEANLSPSRNGNAIYALYEDRSDDTTISVNTILDSQISENITLNASVNYSKLKSENFATIIDLLGATSYLDVDKYADDPNEKQNDLQNPDRKVVAGDRFKYNFNLFSSKIESFLQGVFKTNKVDFFLAGNISKTSHQREGLFQNGGFANNSLGRSEELSFTNYGFKGGLTYKITGRHLIDANFGYLTKAPTLRNSFSNSRENNNTVIGITDEKIFSAEASYIVRTPFFTSKLTGFYTSINDASNIAFFFADGIGGDSSAFVQEVTTGIGKKHIGAELGFEATLLPTLKLKGAASFGQYTYANNPNVYLTTEANDDALTAGFVDGYRDFGKTYLKDYKLSNGPQKAYSLGFEYRDPDYWWFSATGNLMSEAYIGISPMKRTSNFLTDFDGLPIPHDNNLVKELLKQERIDSYFTLNAVGGKSWKFGDYYVGFFASVSNILDEKFKTGGYENGRNANYNQSLEDFNAEKPVNGTRYWYGRGRTYFLNIYLRF